MQSNFYPTVMTSNGVPLDTRHAYTKLDWQAWVAAIASDSTQDLFYSRMASWINQTPTNHPLTDLYDVNTADYPVSSSYSILHSPFAAPSSVLLPSSFCTNEDRQGFDFIARPVVGGVFAQLALNSAPKKAALNS